LSDNEITNVASLKTLINLTDLNLEGNYIADTSPITSLPNLTDFTSDENELLASNKTNNSPIRYVNTSRY
jgi:hypothetical protein